MKKIFIFIVGIVFLSLLGCDPIEDATGKNNLLPLLVKDKTICEECKECPTCEECKEYPKITILTSPCDVFCKSISQLLQCEVPICTPVKLDFVIYKIEMNATDAPIFLSTKPVHLGAYLSYNYKSQLVVGQWYKYCETDGWCIFKISDDGLSLIKN